MVFNRHIFFAIKYITLYLLKPYNTRVQYFIPILNLCYYQYVSILKNGPTS
ncbi:hypothetical protein HanXRQr2_Chr14g0663951 [Helianthus annuus]|uniref:Uncharacterized protein n=1 Tax=Helianthus annuus TaxID=4232 RepID=A0A9K3H994_HELAN|nr:hypothetical protein HanXRQr2_Chr14g0663951 [Helianthus annuus]KAJ0842048.1 hypothetical protein HanPSC8_Chr14g0637241 [Helianthus annuus]